MSFSKFVGLVFLVALLLSEGCERAATPCNHGHTFTVHVKAHNKPVMVGKMIFLRFVPDHDENLFVCDDPAAAVEKSQPEQAEK